MPPSTASPHSSATSHQKSARSSPVVNRIWTASRIAFETESMATGSNAPVTRPASAALTTAGPDSHARRSTSGTLRKARACEPQPFQNCPVTWRVSKQTHEAQCKSFALQRVATGTRAPKPGVSE